MCYNLSLIRQSRKLEIRFDAQFVDESLYQPVYHASGFSTPYWPVISNHQSDLIQFFQWGLIPFWVENESTANIIRTKTLNARAETVATKSAYRQSIKSKRCLILTDGFYEYHDQDKKKYPFYIRLKNRDAFALAGIWDTWQDKEHGTVRHTFSIITTEANPLLERIHNTRKRMPVILKPEDERKWLRNDLETAEIISMLAPYDESQMEAFPVSRLISGRSGNTNTPEAMAHYQYEELVLES